jgi:Xaa-Pro aminopeptidase
MNHTLRRQRLLDELESLELDALLVTRLTNIRYLAGFTGSTAYLIFGRDPVIGVDFRYREQVEKEVSGIDVQHVESSRQLWPTIVGLVGASGGRIGVEATTLSLAQYLDLGELAGVELVPTHGLIEKLRMIKDEDEIAAIREAARLTDEAMNDLLPLLEPGMTEHRVAGEIELLQRAKGGERDASEIIVASGTRSALPHGIATSRRLQAGEPVMFDLGTVVDGYLSDLTRTVHLGPASDEFRQIYAVVLEALQRALDDIAPGMRGDEAHALAGDVIAEAGYGDRFGHSLGHSIGLDVHEPPLLSPRDPTVVEPGMVFTVEPGIYVPGVGGVRIEDVVVVREDGCELLSHAPRELVEL